MSEIPKGPSPEFDEWERVNFPLRYESRMRHARECLEAHPRCEGDQVSDIPKGGPEFDEWESKAFPLRYQARKAHEAARNAGAHIGGIERTVNVYRAPKGFGVEGTLLHLEAHSWLSDEEGVEVAIALIQATPETEVSAVRGEALWRDGRAADFIDEEDSPEDLIAIGLSLVRKGALIRAAGKR